jgi:hypothetical protein
LMQRGVKNARPLAYDSFTDIGLELVLERFAACSCKMSSF